MMEYRTLQQHFEYLVETGFQPSIIRRKMVISKERYDQMSARYIADKEATKLQEDQLDAIGKYSKEELDIMWSEIEFLLVEIGLETDYEKLYPLHMKLERIKNKYSTALLRKQ